MAVEFLRLSLNALHILQRLCLPYSVVASLADASPLPCRFSGRYFAAVVRYSCPTNALLPVLLVIAERMFAATIACLFSGGCFATVVVAVSLVDAWLPSRLVPFPSGYFAATVVGGSPRRHYGFTAL